MELRIGTKYKQEERNHCSFMESSADRRIRSKVTLLNELPKHISLLHTYMYTVKYYTKVKY